MKLLLNLLIINLKLRILNNHKLEDQDTEDVDVRKMREYGPDKSRGPALNKENQGLNLELELKIDSLNTDP